MNHPNRSDSSSVAVVAIVPIKEHSSRVPGKNFRLMNGRPLYSYILNTLEQTTHVSQVVVNTDSETLTRQLTVEFPKVIVINRPNNLRGDAVSVNLLLEDTIQRLELADDTVCLQTHTTNPLVRPSTFDEAVRTFLLTGEHDTLYGVKKLQTRLYDSNGLPINHDPNVLIPTQDLPPVYEENSCVYMFTPKSFRKRNHRIGMNPIQFGMSHVESQDIDTEDDFRYTEWLMATKSLARPRVLITGVLGGIGRSLAKCFFSNGWEVIGIDVRCPSEDDDCSVWMKYFQCVNVIEPEERERFFASFQGKLHCLVNNAAVQYCGPTSQVTQQMLDSMYECNVKALIALSNLALPLLKGTKGSIVNVSSVHATHTSHSIAGYAATKGAVSALTRALAIEYAPDDVRVNAVAPGAVNTPMLMEGLKRSDVALEEALSLLESKHLRRRILSGIDVAEAVLFLADGKRSGSVIGQVLVVDGGATIRLSTET